MTAILRANPNLKGVQFDAGSVIEDTKKQIEAAGLAGRCAMAAGDFFRSLPAGADAYILKNVIHDWDDDRSASILTNCRNAIMGNGKLLIVETVIPAGNEPAFGKLVDLNMMVMTGGREGPKPSVALLEASGFRITRIVPTMAQVSVIEAKAD